MTSRGSDNQMKKEKLSRLLQLYPVEVLRDRWGDFTGTKNEICDQVAESVAEVEIVDFCRVSQPRTKQRVLLLSNEGGVKSLGDPLLGGDIPPLWVKRTKRRVEEFYLLDVAFTAIVGPPYEEQSVEFVWPVTIVAEDAWVQLTGTMMEKNIGTYLGTNVNTYGVKKDLDEDGVIALLGSACSDPDAVRRADINKGVKALWEAGSIDAAHSKWKASKGTLSETMDEKCFLRKDDQNLYERAMKAPLFKTVFHTMDASKKFPAIFTVVPCDGEVAVTRYPETTDEVTNVVEAILSNN